MTTAFGLLSDPSRRLLLDELRGGERTVGALVDRLAMSQPSVSKHLRVLRDAGLVSVQVDAQRRIYRLQADGLREVDAWLQPFRVHWQERVDALERTLDAMEDGTDGRLARQER